MNDVFLNYKNLLSTYINTLNEFISNTSYSSFIEDNQAIISTTYLLLRISEIASFIPIDVNYIEQRKIETQIKQLKNIINKDFDNKNYQDIYRYATELIPIYSNFLD